MKNRYIHDIKIGDQINDLFVLVEKQIGKKKDGGLFANMTFADKTGKIKAVMWNNVSTLLKNISIGDFVIVKAIVGEYKGNIQLVLKNISSILDNDKINPADFLPVTKKDINQMFNRLRSITDTISNPCIKHLFKLFWDDDYFVKQFKKAPAAKHLHHAYIGGLLEHVLSMAIIGDQIVTHYNGVDRDLLLAGIVLHDIGKIKELSYNRKIDYTDEGRLLSHIVIGIIIINEKINQISDFPQETKYLLEHLIVSHHGSKEFGSPALPKSIEAVLLNCIDDMDFKVNCIRNYIDNDIVGGKWTAYNRLMERHFYKENS